MPNQVPFPPKRRIHTLEHLNFLCIALGRREDFGRQGRKRRLNCAKPSISNEAGQSRNRYKVYTKNSIALISTVSSNSYAKIRDELLDGDMFLTLADMKYVVDRWRMNYNHYRPHSSLGHMTPATFGQLCIETDHIVTSKKVLR